MINKTNLSLLYVRGSPWVKRRSEWDVTMGSFDGAKVSELVGLYMLDKLAKTDLDLGLYRDDGLGATNLKGWALEAKGSKSSRSSENVVSESPSPPTSRPLISSTSSWTSGLRRTGSSQRRATSQATVTAGQTTHQMCSKTSGQQRTKGCRYSAPTRTSSTRPSPSTRTP